MSITKSELANRLHTIRESIVHYNEKNKNYDIIPDEYELCGVTLNNTFVTNNAINIPFGVVNCFFICSGLNLKSLINSPNKVVYKFDCSNNELTSLSYAPRKINYKFNCSYNKIERLDFLIECKKLVVHNNKITYISNDIDISKISLYKNPYHYFKKYNYEYN